MTPTEHRLPEGQAEIRRHSMLGPMVKVLRPKQWTKNGFLFAALIFSFHFTNLGDWVMAITGFASFCLLSSTGYILNDIRDREADKRHPTKRFRPIASGSLPTKVAWSEAIISLIIGLAVAFTLGRVFVLISLLYLASTTSYSLYFKHVVILDVMMITAGFLWRAVAGAVAISVPISPWFLLCTAFLALFLGFSKRRGELSLLEKEQAMATRKNLSEYSSGMISDFQAMTTSGTVISYALYTVSDQSPTPWLLITLPYVLYVIFRYIYLVEHRLDRGAPDEILVRDRPILLTCLLYTATVLAVLMFAPDIT